MASYLKLTPDDRVLGVLPLSFDYGQNQLLSTWHAGAAVAPLDYLTPRDVVKAVARHGITTLAGVPRFSSTRSTTSSTKVFHSLHWLH